MKRIEGAASSFDLGFNVPACQESASAKKNQEPVAKTEEPIVVSSNEDIIVDSLDDFFESYISGMLAQCTLNEMD
jgi:hypothetical protein